MFDVTDRTIPLLALPGDYPLAVRQKAAAADAYQRAVDLRLNRARRLERARGVAPKIQGTVLVAGARHTRYFDFVQQLAEEGKDLSRAALEALSIDAYRMNRITGLQL
jgi:chromosome segregation and condensation protein ScpB